MIKNDKIRKKLFSKEKKSKDIKQKSDELQRLLLNVVYIILQGITNSVFYKVDDNFEGN
ncbi:MAG: hypothetical protein QXY52_04055 [Conexivisphaerales archaeon]